MRDDASLMLMYLLRGEQKQVRGHHAAACICTLLALQFLVRGSIHFHENARKLSPKGSDRV
jgi:hypothetical protein